MNEEEKRQFLAACAHIPTSEVLKDIADTEAEIATMEREIPSFDTLAKVGPEMERRMCYLRARSRETGIKERKAFIKRLQLLLEVRGEAVPA